MLKNYHKTKEIEDKWLDESYGKLNNLSPIKERAKEHLEPTKVRVKNNYFSIDKEN